MTRTAATRSHPHSQPPEPQAQALRQSVDALGTPLADIFAALDAGTTLRMLERSRPKERTSMLQFLGVPSARLSMRAAELFLSTLRRRKDLHERASVTLASPTLYSLTDALAAVNTIGDIRGLDDAVTALADARLELLLAAFAIPLKSRGHTALLRLSITRFPMAGWAADAVESVIQTCTALESAWALERETSTDALPAATVPSAQPRAARPQATPTHESSAEGSEWSQRASALDEQLASARAATTQIHTDLGHERAPRAEDLAALHTLKEAAAQLHRDLVAQAPQPANQIDGPDDVRALLRACQAAAAHASQLAQTFHVLSRVVDLQGPADNQAVQSVRRTARLLQDNPNPEAVEQLRLLLDLIDATADDDDDAIGELHAQLKDAPSDVNQVTALILRGKVTAPRIMPPSTTLSTGEDASAATPPPPPHVAAPAAAEEPPAPTPTKAEATTPTTATPLRPSSQQAGNTAPHEHPAIPSTGSRVEYTTDQNLVLSSPTPEPATVIAQLIESDELALAAHAAAATGRQTLARALGMLQLAHAVRSETGPCAAVLRERIDEELIDPGTGASSSDYLVLMAASLRGALLTADPNAGELAKALAPQFQEMPHLQRVCNAIGTSSARGQLTAAGGLNVLDAVASADNDIREAARAASEHLAASRHLHFPRANTVVRDWWDTNGLIGCLLHLAATDQRARVETVSSELHRLTSNALNKALKDTDDRLRGGAAPLQGAARKRILQYAADSLDVVNTWLLATRTSRRGPVLSAPLIELRKEVLAQAEDAETELSARASIEVEPIAAATARLAQHSLHETVALLAGTTTLSGGETSAVLCLNRDLLRCPGLPFGRDLTPERPLQLDDVALASRRSWDEAARDQAEIGNFAAARLAVEAAENENAAEDTTLRSAIEQARVRKGNEAKARLDDVRSNVDIATRHGCLPEPGRSDIIGQIQSATINLAEDDFSAMNRHLDLVEQQLPLLATNAKQELLNRARAEINLSRTTPDDAYAKIAQLVDEGDLATAEDYLLTALAGEEPPTATPENDLEDFFPAVPEQLPSGITPALIDAVQTGGTHAGLDYTHLRERERNITAEAMRQWSALLKSWNANKNNQHVLRSALRIAGIEYASERTTEIPYAPNRRWIELVGVQLTGQAQLPAFGTDAGGRMHVLLTTEVSDVTKLLAWAAQDSSHLPVLMVVLDTLPVDSRRILAQHTAKQPSKVLLCLDAAALAYLASKASNRFTTTERILAPFAATNPYRPDANEGVPSEMFYGRREELASITAKDGAQLLYGGRQLGKSALLRAAARRFEATPGHVALYLPLPTTVGIGQDTDELWDMIGRALESKSIPLPRQRRLSARDRAWAAIEAWLTEEPTRQLLALFDECDNFFDAEAQSHFRQISRLRDLRAATNRRFKPVFAGLHQVARFSGLPNQPLSDAHFGPPIVIGPLAPAPAFQLIRQPLETLGIRLPDRLIHRILAYCNYHPKLLQLAGQALVRNTLQARSTSSAPDTPWHIDNQALERVVWSPELTDRTRAVVNLTLDLDPRYKLIALVVALEAHANGVDQRTPTRNLRAECEEWWPQGFSDQSPDEFRALLEEMEGLGVLTGDANGWRLRSSNVLRLLGNQNAIEEALANHDLSRPLTKLTATQARRPITGDRISPLTEAQLARLTARGNELRLVLGSAATSLDEVGEVLKEQHRRAPSKLDAIVRTNTAGQYKKELSNGREGAPHRIILEDLRSLSPENARRALEQALEIFPPKGVTRTVVALADATVPEHRALAADFDPDNLLLRLRRASPEGVSSWIAEVPAMDAFTNPNARNQLLELTGGWPVLLDTAVQVTTPGRSAASVCKRLREAVAGQLGARLLDALGLRDDPALRDIVKDLSEFDEPLPWSDLVDLLGDAHDNPEAVLECLRDLDVLDQDEQGKLSLDATIRRAWGNLRA